ncbi:MAG TPA: PilN domain-containing protein [Fimbriimonas sp.]|nr:PilN domain-containing protein [Fimbriimonas sp.]
MPHINLIESRILATKKAERQVQISKFAFFGVATVFAAVYIAMFAQGAGLSAQQQSIEEKLKKLRPMFEQIEASKKNEDELSTRLNTLEDARNLTGRWGRLMEHLSTNTPPNVWLTSFRSVALDAEKPIRITFNGVGQTQTDVSEMMLRTQNAADLESVNLVGSQERVVEKTTAIEFEMGGDIVGTAKKKPKPVAEGEPQ